MKIHILPTEILLEIFKQLKSKDIFECRRVCRRWELTVDGASNEFWREICKRDHNDVHKDAYRKSQLSWRDLCKSLDLWAEVATADVRVLKVPNCEITSMFRILSNGIIACNKGKDPYCKQLLIIKWTEFDTIAYHDLLTMKEIRRERFDFPFSYYDENDTILVVQTDNINSSIRIIPKKNKECALEVSILKEGRYQSKWALNGNRVYYLTESYKLMCVMLVEDENNITWETIIVVDSYVINDTGDVEYIKSIESVVDIKDKQVNILTSDNEGRMYSLIGNKLKNICALTNSYNKVDIIKRHGFNWISENQLSNAFNTGARFDMHCAYFYGNVLILIANVSNGVCLFENRCKTVMQIYYKPFRDGVLDIFNSEPVKSLDLPEYYYPSFQQIDVLEIENGHKIIFTYSGDVVVVELSHNVEENE